MHIKNITINNFKSFHGFNIIEDIKPCHNVIVGDNGAGKSVFLQAIEFLLRLENRQSSKGNIANLLSQRETKGFVEVLFSGCDQPEILTSLMLNGLVPYMKLKRAIDDQNHIRSVREIVMALNVPHKSIESHLLKLGYVFRLNVWVSGSFDNEITIRKEFSLITHIRFYVNGKQMDKNKMLALYETLSLNYIHSSFLITPIMVQKFIKFSRKELFDYLMKNIGATLLKTYETIQKIFLVLEDQKGKIDKLLELFQDVNSKDDKNYFMLLKRHRKIKSEILAEILWRKIQKCVKMKIKLEGALSSLQKCNLDDSSSSSVSLLQHSYSIIESALHDKQGILNDLREENCKLIKNKEKIHLSVQDISNTIYFMKKGKEETSKNSLESQADEKIKFISKELENVSKELESKKSMLTELNSQKQMNEGIRLNLLSKLRRTKDFRSKEERNFQLQAKINSLSEQIKKMEEEVNILLHRKEELLKSQQYINGEIENLNKRMQEQEESYGQNIFQAKQQLNNFLDTMCDNRREERMLEDKISEISLNIQEKGLQLKKKVGNAIIAGAESLLAIIEACKNSPRHKWLSDSYYGMVIENFECSEELSVAVESVVGNRLFAHIVSNNKTGTIILKEINNQKLGGEIMFLPIENLIETSYNYPTYNDAEPILNRMKFQPNVEKVMKYLFGHVLICRNIKVAINIMRRTNQLICVTLEGDKVSKSVISGGYFNKSKCSKILFSEINRLQETKILKNEELEKVQNKINELEANINRSISYKQQLKQKHFNTDLKENLRILITDEKHARKELIKINELIERKKYSVRELQVTQRMLIEEISEDVEEINKKTNSEVMLLNKELKELEKILHDKNIELTTIESKKLKLENNLSHQRKLKDMLELDTSEMKIHEKKLQDYKVKEEIIDNRIKIITNKIEETEKLITELIREKLKLEEDIKECSELDVSVGRREKIVHRIIQYKNKISEYKALYKKSYKPSSQSNEYSELTLPMLYNELANVNKILKSDLAGREIEKRKKKITRLYKKYERLLSGFTKNYVIYSNFVEWFHSYIFQCLNNVSDNFAEYFELLTSGGNANLFMDTDESSGSWPALEDITGLQMCIQFPNSIAAWNLANLSFSQSLLVTLAFKFSVIKSFLIPILMMDEIDRPLEDEQKKIVCHQILNLEGQVQTFTTSHSKEWIKLGKDVYHATFKYTGSNINKLSEAEVAHFLYEKQTPVTGSYSFGSGWDTSSSIF